MTAALGKTARKNLKIQKLEAHWNSDEISEITTDLDGTLSGNKRKVEHVLVNPGTNDMISLEIKNLREQIDLEKELPSDECGVILKTLQMEFKTLLVKQRATFHSG